MTEPGVYERVVSAEEAGERLDTLLGKVGPLPSRSAVARLIDAGRVQVDGRVAVKRHVVSAGERLTLDVPSFERGDNEPEHIPLDIRFEDASLIVLSKQADLVVHPAHGNWSGTLVNALLAHSDELGGLQGEDRPGIVHRLDKDTTGLMLVAKTDHTQAALQEAIKIRAIDRRYLTLVHGYIAPDTGIIDAPLARDSRDRTRMAVSDSLHAKQAVTTFRVLERYMAGQADDGYTLVECKLYTGRTHQIRVHMAYIDHACVGDQVYGSRRIKADRGLERQFLHSYRLEFDHPVTAEHLRFIDPLPDDLASVLRQIEPDSMSRTEAGDEVFELLAGAGDPER